MAEMTFFMARDCSKSQQQLKKLKDAGNCVNCRDLTFYKWSREELLPFLRGRQPLEMINQNAPAIRNGSIDPVTLTFDQAVSLMVQMPSLIKGPLIKADNLHLHGNDTRLRHYTRSSREDAKKADKKVIPLPRKNSESLKKSFGDGFHPFWGSFYACSVG